MCTSTTAATKKTLFLHHTHTHTHTRIHTWTRVLHCPKVEAIGYPVPISQRRHGHPIGVIARGNACERRSSCCIAAETHGNSVPIIMDGTANQFPAKMHYIAGFCLYDLKIIHWGRKKLGPRHQFPLGSSAFTPFLFYETTTAARTGRASRLDYCNALT